MKSTVDAAGDPVPTSSALMAAAKHISTRCRNENVAFLKCKKDDPNPEKCLDKGHQVTSCVFSFEKAPRQLRFGKRKGMRDLHQSCSKEMNAYAKCLYYHTNEFEFCREEQKEFEKACPI